MSSKTDPLVINMKFSVVEDRDEFGYEEIYLRSIVQKFKEFLDIAGRGNLQVETTYDRPNRRPSKRKPKSKGASNG